MARIFLFALLAACQDDFILPDKGGGGDDTDTPTSGGWCAVQAVFQSECTQCHNTGALGDLDLETDPYNAIVNHAAAGDAAQQLVVPGDPTASVLLQKMKGTASFGGVMPPGGADAGDIAVVEAWIQDGATDACDGPVDTDLPVDTDPTLDTDESPTRYHPTGWADPAMHGHDAKYQVQACVTCHGETLEGVGAALSCDTCHPAGWRTDCTFCHGDPAEGTGAPPVHMSGEDDAANASFIPHLPHVQQTDIKRALDCVECHVKPTDVLSPGHLFIGDDSPGVAEVDFSMGLSDAASWDGNGSCSNLYCHGDGRRDNGTIGHTDTVSNCKSCHPDNTSGEAALDRMSGEHEKHVDEGIACHECHGDTTNAQMEIIGFAEHVNGTPDVALRQGMSRNNGRCSGTCHGEYHLSRSW